MSLDALVLALFDGMQVEAPNSPEVHSFKVITWCMHTVNELNLPAAVSVCSLMRSRSRSSKAAAWNRGFFEAQIMPAIDAAIFGANISAAFCLWVRWRGAWCSHLYVKNVGLLPHLQDFETQWATQSSGG